MPDFKASPKLVVGFTLATVAISVLVICIVLSIPILVACAVLALSALGVTILYTLPKLQVDQLKGLTTEKRFEVENEARKTVAQILAGVVLIAGLYFSWQTIRQDTERLRQERSLSDRQLELDKERKRMQVFSELMGHRTLIAQFHRAKLGADVNVLYEFGRWNNEGRPSKSNYLEDLKEQLHWSEQMLLDIAKYNQQMAQTIGQVSLSFPVSPQLKSLVKNASDTLQFTKDIDPPTPKMSDPNLTRWKTTQEKQIDQFVSEKYEGPINALLDYLEGQISAKPSKQ